MGVALGMLPVVGPTATALGELGTLGTVGTEVGEMGEVVVVGPAAAVLGAVGRVVRGGGVASVGLEVMASPSPPVGAHAGDKPSGTNACAPRAGAETEVASRAFACAAAGAVAMATPSRAATALRSMVGASALAALVDAAPRRGALEPSVANRLRSSAASSHSAIARAREPQMAASA